MNTSQPTELNVLYACDENYAPYTGVSMTSLLENNRQADSLTIYLAPMGFSEKTLEQCKELVHRYGRELCILDTKKAEQCIQQYHCGAWNGSTATWLRFFVLEQIPARVTRLLWLDSDTAVCGDLRELANLDMQGCAIGAVCDSLCLYDRKRLGIPSDHTYYNAGVLLFDLEQWRPGNLQKKMMAHLAENIDRYELNDQDLLNDFFRDSIFRLPQRFNLQGLHLAYTPQQYLSVYRWEPGSFYSPEEIRAATEKPAVVHFLRFLGNYPWEGGRNLHPAKPLYEKWKALSPWSGAPETPPKQSFVFTAEKLLYRLLPRGWFLHLFALICSKK